MCDVCAVHMSQCSSGDERDNFWALVLIFSHVGPWDRTKIIKIGAGAFTFWAVFPAPQQTLLQAF